jgi:hypothetical protein
MAERNMCSVDMRDTVVPSRSRDIAGAECFYSLEGNMCGTAMRGAVALPGSLGHITCKRIPSEAGRSRV